MPISGWAFLITVYDPITSKSASVAEVYGESKLEHSWESDNHFERSGASQFNGLVDHIDSANRGVECSDLRQGPRQF